MYDHVQAQSSHSDVSMLPFDVLLTTYDIALIDQDFLSQFQWHYSVIDEAQRLKNASSVLYSVLKERYVMPRCLLMTGTPIQNNLTELWALMHFCMPSIFGTLEEFLHSFKAVGDTSTGHDGANVKEQLNTLKWLLGAFMIRRTKTKLIECGTLVLPPLTEITVMVPLVALQKSVYTSILRKELSRLLALASGTSNVQSLQNMVVQLRKSCSHPYLFPGIEPEPYEEGEHLVQVIFYEQDWNPQVDRQALQRAHRIGQMNHVLSINLVTGRTIEEVIMQRARKKLQLSQNIIDDEVSEQVGKELSGACPSDLKSMIYGLRLFDPEESSKEKSSEPTISELNTLAAEVLAKRTGKELDKDMEKFVLNPTGPSGNDFGIKISDSTVNIDPCLDEASYRSWVEKFKEVAESTDKTTLELESRRITSEEKLQRLESARKKAEEKKLAKWQALGYESLSVPNPIPPVNSDLMSDHCAVNFVFGDCTNPSEVCASEPTVIFSSVDDSGHWGHGGMFDALAKLSTRVPKAYEHAAEFGDLHLGDLHVIQIDDAEGEQLKDGGMPRWVALAVVQSYNPRRKIPRSSISTSDLELCLSKASSVASQKSASLHMPRIGYQDGSDRAIWYSTERLLRKYSSLFGIKIYVYYYRKPSR
ncbi:unnamed protein product [Amaranthus hypochondriacus]